MEIRRILYSKKPLLPVAGRPQIRPKIIRIGYHELDIARMCDSEHIRLRQLLLDPVSSSGDLGYCRSDVCWGYVRS